MRSSIPMPAMLRDDLNIIDRNSQRLLFLVNQLLDFGKVEPGGDDHEIHLTEYSSIAGGCL